MGKIPKIIATDFDGTITMHSRYPKLGVPRMGFIKYLIDCRKQGSKIILWTCRDGFLLEQALEFCKYYGLEFDAVNDNLPETKMKMGNMRKVFANVYYDDNARIVYEEFPK